MEILSNVLGFYDMALPLRPGVEAELPKEIRAALPGPDPIKAHDFDIIIV